MTKKVNFNPKLVAERLPEYYYQKLEREIQDLNSPINLAAAKFNEDCRKNARKKSKK